MRAVYLSLLVLFGATMLGCLQVRGYGMSGDAHHVVSPESNGRGARLCMMRALISAGARPGDVSYVNAHATSTPVGEDGSNGPCRTFVDGL
jgi:3-oxoacyl-[acyl-carrier-protein] synthase II